MLERDSSLLVSYTTLTVAGAARESRTGALVGAAIVTADGFYRALLTNFARQTQQEILGADLTSARTVRRLSDALSDRSKAQISPRPPCSECMAVFRPCALFCSAATRILLAGHDAKQRRAQVMSTLLSTIQDRLRKRAAYSRTKAELEAMPLEVAIDLDIYKPDAAKLAAEAVYGR